MRTEIAKSDLGLCGACGLRMEAGEWVSQQGGGTIHTGCLSWRSENRVVSHTESSGFLFSDSEQAVIEHAKEIVGVKSITFDGPSAMQVDLPRLAGQLVRVFELMRDGKYRTLSQIAVSIGCLETSASARLRDLRKARFGKHSVVSRQVEKSSGLYEYALTLNEESKHGRRAA